MNFVTFFFAFFFFFLVRSGEGYFKGRGNSKMKVNPTYTVAYPGGDQSFVAGVIDGEIPEKPWEKPSDADLPKPPSHHSEFDIC